MGRHAEKPTKKQKQNNTNHEFQKRRETSWWHKRRKGMSLVGTRKKRMPFLTPKSCNDDKVRSIFKLSKPTTRQPQKKQSSFHSVNKLNQTCSPMTPLPTPLDSNSTSPKKHWFLHTGKKKHWFLSTAPKISNPFQTRNFLLAIHFWSQYKSVRQKSISASVFFRFWSNHWRATEIKHLVPRKKVKNEQVKKKSALFFFCGLFFRLENSLFSSPL